MHANTEAVKRLPWTVTTVLIQISSSPSLTRFWIKMPRGKDLSDFDRGFIIGAWLPGEQSLAVYRYEQ